MTMPLANLILNLAAFACAGLILIRAEPAIARMSAETRTMVRYAMLLLAGGALAIILSIIAGASIDLPTVLLLAGVALLMICERRLRYLISRPGDRHA